MDPLQECGQRRPVLDPRSTRRTEGLRTQGRSAQVVEAVLCATAALLGTVGYSALRVDDVAVRSGVNKTTIYRRWPTKIDLVAAALRHLRGEPSIPDTGSLRGDLIAMVTPTVVMTRTPLGQGIVRMIQAERAHPELDTLAKEIRAEQLRCRLPIVERAIARHELPLGSDPHLIVELVVAPVMFRVVHGGAVPDDAFIAAVVDMVLAGARAGAAVRS